MRLKNFVEIAKAEKSLNWIVAKSNKTDLQVNSPSSSWNNIHDLILKWN